MSIRRPVSAPSSSRVLGSVAAATERGRRRGVQGAVGLEVGTMRWSGRDGGETTGGSDGTDGEIEGVAVATSVQDLSSALLPSLSSLMSPVNSASLQSLAAKVRAAAHACTRVHA